MTAALTFLRRARARRIERRRLADWAWQRESLILAQLSADVRQAISAVHLANMIGSMVPDVAELLNVLVRAGLADLTFGGPRLPGGTRVQGSLYYLTPEGLDERYRRCGQ